MTTLFTNELSAQVGFSGNPLDRLSELRDDEAAQAGLRGRSDACSLVIVADTPLLKIAGAGLDPWFSLEELQSLGSVQEQALLGRTQERTVFGSLLPDDAATTVIRPASDGRPETRQLVFPGRDDLALMDLRSIAVRGLLERPAIAILSQAKSLLHWHRRHRFCSNCGVPTEVASAGWKRECPSCKAQHFPRTDPVVIMLATAGDRCLLGRQARFAPGMYSALAGFVEPGETVEEAVRREIMEEAGVRTGRVTYLASQPWPFPASLMIGCMAEALTENITVDRTELEDARWFSRDEVLEMLGETHGAGFAAPQSVAIARILLKTWANSPRP